jgi:hypothetical protein
LPLGCIPSALYSLSYRQQTLEQVDAGLPAEQAAPLCPKTDRIADASTVRRWFLRRMESLERLTQAPKAPTIAAWDWVGACRILIAESNPP